MELPFLVVSPDYFSTMGIQVREGRGYTSDDVRSGDRTLIIVNQAAADRFWPGQSALGRRLRPQSLPDAWRGVVGVVSDVKVGSMSESPTPQLY